MLIRVVVFNQDMFHNQMGTCLSSKYLPKEAIKQRKEATKQHKEATQQHKEVIQRKDRCNNNNNKQLQCYRTPMDVWCILKQSNVRSTNLAILNALCLNMELIKLVCQITNNNKWVITFNNNKWVREKDNIAEVTPDERIYGWLCFDSIFQTYLVFKIRI